MTVWFTSFEFGGTFSGAFHENKVGIVIFLEGYLMWRFRFHTKTNYTNDASVSLAASKASPTVCL